MLDQNGSWADFNGRDDDGDDSYDDEENDDDDEDNDDKNNDDDAWSKRKLSIFRGTRAVAMAASFSVNAVPDIALIMMIRWMEKKKTEMIKKRFLIWG